MGTATQGSADGSVSLGAPQPGESMRFLVTLEGEQVGAFGCCHQ